MPVPTRTRDPRYNRPVRRHPQQIQRDVSAQVGAIVKGLTGTQQRQLKERGFASRVRMVNTRLSQTFGGWPAGGPPAAADVSGRSPRVLVRTYRGRLVNLNEPLQPILRHEVGHQVLSAKGVGTRHHHDIIAPRETQAGLRSLDKKRLPRSGYDTPTLSRAANTGLRRQRDRVRQMRMRISQQKRARGVDF